MHRLRAFSDSLRLGRKKRPTSRDGFKSLIVILTRQTHKGLRQPAAGAESEPGKGSTFIIRLPVKHDRWEGV
ncbi:MAG: hypothetical protein ABSG91_10545 [Syntrophobacteraceae bacterium]|jgi:hypothetical protein